VHVSTAEKEAWQFAFYRLDNPLPVATWIVSTMSGVQWKQSFQAWSRSWKIGAS
jgi:hypothetical protein